MPFWKAWVARWAVPRTQACLLSDCLHDAIFSILNCSQELLSPAGTPCHTLAEQQLLRVCSVSPAMGSMGIPVDGAAHLPGTVTFCRAASSIWALAATCRPPPVQLPAHSQLAWPRPPSGANCASLAGPRDAAATLGGLSVPF